MEELNLAALPALVIRGILNCVDVEYLENTRFIAKSWTALAVESIPHHTLPVINSFSWELNLSKWKLHMQIAGKYRAFFGVESWRYTNEEELGINRHEIVEIECAVEARNTWMFARMNKLFARCSSIERVEFGKYIEYYDFVKEGFGRTKVDELHTARLEQFDANSMKLLTRFIRTNSPSKVSVKIGESNAFWITNSPDFNAFLPVATNLCTVEVVIQSHSLYSSLPQLKTLWEGEMARVIVGMNLAMDVETSEGPAEILFAKITLTKSA